MGRQYPGGGGPTPPLRRYCDLPNRILLALWLLHHDISQTRTNTAEIDNFLGSWMLENPGERLRKAEGKLPATFGSRTHSRRRSFPSRWLHTCLEEGSKDGWWHRRGAQPEQHTLAPQHVGDERCWLAVWLSSLAASALSVFEEPGPGSHSSLGPCSEFSHHAEESCDDKKYMAGCLFREFRSMSP